MAMQISDSDGIFARAYANAIKTQFQLDVGEHYCILTSPVTQRGMAAGDLIYKQMTNYLIYKFADNLQYSDNPSYTGGSAGSYIQQLHSYITWVKTQGDPSSVVATRKLKAQDEATAANKRYFEILAEAKNQYNQVKDLFPDQTFWQWAALNYPPLASADRTRKALQTGLDQAMQLYFGPDATVLSTYMDNIANARGPNRLPGYNQDGLVDDLDMIADAIKLANSGQKLPEQDIAPLTIRVPAYSIANYISGVQAWVTAAGHGAKRDQVVTIDINEGLNTHWEDFGFKEVRGGGSAGYWPLFSAQVYVGGKWEPRTLKTQGRENSISLRLAMIGIQKFDIRAGEWDIANIKALFPNRLPGAPEVLTPKYARIVSVLVGYDVELQLEFASDIKEEVHKIYEEVKKTGGRMSVLGFRVAVKPGGVTEGVETKFDDIKWDKVKGSMSLTPTAGQVYPTILASIAQRFD